MEWVTERIYHNIPITKSIQKYAARKNIYTLKEYCNSIGDSNKVFCSQWLDNRNILCGTKCNKLWLVDSESNNTFQISTLFPGKGQQGKNSSPCSNQLVSRGIHAIGINESNTCLAVSGGLPEDVGFYSLPDLSPLGVGLGHKEWIFSLTWLKNTILVTGANDGIMQLWDASETYPNYNTVSCDKCPTIEPIARLENHADSSKDKIRSLVYNDRNNMLASLQTGFSRAALFLWDVETLQRMHKYDLSRYAENVCMKYNPEFSLFGIGSRQNVTLFDHRERETDIGRDVVSVDKSWGVRSIAYNEHILSIGTGRGNVYFFDLRAWKYLSNDDGGEPIALKTSEGWVCRDTNYYTFFNSIPKLPNAIYSHSYSPDNRKIYVAGGPLQLGLSGNYSAVWQ